MSKTVHSVKLFPYASVELDRLSYMNGDIVYDSTNGTIRVMNGTSQGGIKLATQTWTNNLLSSYATNTSVNTAISTALTGYASTASLSSYLTTATASSTYATQSSLSSYVTTSSQTSALALKAPIANPVHTGTLTVPTAIIGGVNIKSLAIAMGAALA